MTTVWRTVLAVVLNPRVYRVDCGRNAASVPRAHGGDYVHVVELLRSVCLVFSCIFSFFKTFFEKKLLLFIIRLYMLQTTLNSSHSFTLISHSCCCVDVTVRATDCRPLLRPWQRENKSVVKRRTNRLISSIVNITSLCVLMRGNKRINEILSLKPFIIVKCFQANAENDDSP